MPPGGTSTWSAGRLLDWDQMDNPLTVTLTAEHPPREASLGHEGKRNKTYSTRNKTYIGALKLLLETRSANNSERVIQFDVSTVERPLESLAVGLRTVLVHQPTLLQGT